MAVDETRDNCKCTPLLFDNDKGNARSHFLELIKTAVSMGVDSTPDECI